METVTIPRAEYDALLEARAALADLAEAQAIMERIRAGEEIYPAALVDSLLAGANPVAAFRAYRGFSQAALARAAGVDRVQLHQIEKGEAVGSVATLRRIADALGVSLDELAPR
jgi:DNA-binding XRE family transcriptional regulator